MEKSFSLSSMTLIKRFEGSCGTFQEEKKLPIVVNDIQLINPEK